MTQHVTSSIHVEYPPQSTYVLALGWPFIIMAGIGEILIHVKMYKLFKIEVDTSSKLLLYLLIPFVLLCKC